LPISRYLALGFPVSIITSRGCPNRCIFCQGRRMVGRKVRYRDPMKVVDEIEDIISYGFTRINIADDLFVSKKERAQAICKEILRRKLNFTWSAFSRVNTVDFDTLHLMHEAGCDTVSFGIESGNPEILKRIRKGITIRQARRAVNLCREVGIMPHASFMVGLPGETHATLRDTQEFAQSLDILYGYHHLAPFPGTTVREEIGSYDLEILTDDWALYDANRAIVRTSSVSAEELETFVEEYYQVYRDYWEKLEQRYREGTTTQKENLNVSGHHRTEFTYRLLSEDIIEEHCQFPVEILGAHPGKEEMLLSEKITQVTGVDGEVVKKALKNFIENGYLKTQNINNHLSWYWTHNKKEDVWKLPISAKQSSQVSAP
jgi:anaerobic magnesium-protoporphyrin IX monomethyl ester cyclase